MEIQIKNFKFNAPDLEIETKNLAYSCKSYNVYTTSVKWNGHYTQHMFHVKPFDIDGCEVDVELYFTSLVYLLRFINCYKSKHTQLFWYNRQDYHHCHDYVLYLLYRSKMKLLD